MPHKHSSAEGSKEAPETSSDDKENAPTPGTAAANAALAADFAQKKADPAYEGLSDKQIHVEQAKEQTIAYFSHITHADKKADQVARMDKKVLNGTVFRQAARLHVSEEGYDGAEDDGDGTEEGKAEEEEEDDDTERMTSKAHNAGKSSAANNEDAAAGERRAANGQDDDDDAAVNEADESGEQGEADKDASSKKKHSDSDNGSKHHHKRHHHHHHKTTTEPA